MLHFGSGPLPTMVLTGRRPHKSSSLASQRSFHPPGACIALAGNAQSVAAPRSWAPPLIPLAVSLTPLGRKGRSSAVTVRNRCLGSRCMPGQIATPLLSTDGRGQAHDFCSYRGALDCGSLDIDQSSSWPWLCDNDSDAIRGPQRTNPSSTPSQATMWRPANVVETV